MFTSRELLNAKSMLILSADDDFNVTVFGGPALGLEHRFGDHMFGMVELALSVTPNSRELDGVFELGWSWY
jgi:hypothetical protein